MVSAIKNKVKTCFEKLLGLIINFLLGGARYWRKDIAGFALVYNASDDVGQKGVLALRHGGSIIFHSHPNGAVDCPVCESGSQAEHDAITAQLIKIYSKQ